MDRTQELNALLIGRNFELIKALPWMLTRAGFRVDVITSSSLVKTNRYVSNCDVVLAQRELLPMVMSKEIQSYDWIVVTDDKTLAEIRDSNLSSENKLRLLPVLRCEDFMHLYSKIGLSTLLSNHNVCTPPYYIARSYHDAQDGAQQLGYPVLVKIDSSSGGDGVFECNSVSDFLGLKQNMFSKPVLIQKKINGIEKDFSAIFLGGQLIHFSHSKIEKVCRNKFGPSSVRRYYPLSANDLPIFEELVHLGKVLGAHGFVTISCIESGDKRFYFEADVRPSVWVECPKYFEADPAMCIKKWFYSGGAMCSSDISAIDKAKDILIPYCPRLSMPELFLNRYNAWRYITFDEIRVVFLLIIKCMNPFFVKRHLKMILSLLRRFFSCRQLWT